MLVLVAVLLAIRHPVCVNILRFAIYYALPVVCTSRYILLAKRSILTKAQVEPTMDIFVPV
jgi:hypothetical protein